MTETSAEVTPAEKELQARRDAQEVEEARKQKEIAEALPTPVGFKLLIALPQVEDRYESGILKAETTVNAESVLASIGVVLDMGSDAYTDQERYPKGPWCKTGDYVMFRPYSGTKFKIGGHEYRILNEDSIDAVVPKPRAIARA